MEKTRTAKAKAKDDKNSMVVFDNIIFETKSNNELLIIKINDKNLDEHLDNIAKNLKTLIDASGWNGKIIILRSDDEIVYGSISLFRYAIYCIKNKIKLLKKWSKK